MRHAPNTRPLLAAMPDLFTANKHILGSSIITLIPDGILILPLGAITMLILSQLGDMLHS